MSGESKGSGGGDDKVGYRHPPKHTRFQKGNNANPRGRAAGDRDDFAKSAQSVLASPIEVRERGRKRLVPRSEAHILNLFEKAKRGDVSAADRLVTLHAQSTKTDGGGPTIIEVHNALPDQIGDDRERAGAPAAGPDPSGRTER